MNIRVQGDQTVTIPRWLWAGGGSLMLLVVGGIGSVAGYHLQQLSTLAHANDRRLTRLEAVGESNAREFARIQESMLRVEAKLDRWMQEQR